MFMILLKQIHVLDVDEVADVEGDVSALHLSDTLNMPVKPMKIFLGHFEKTVSASFFQNLNFFHFSWHIIWLVRRAATISYWRRDLG